MTDAVNIKINGAEYTDFTDVSVTKSVEALAGSFMFQTTSTPNINFPIKVNSSCEIIIQGEQVINGFVDRLAINYSADGASGSHSIQIFGHDRTVDLHDSTIGGSESSEFNASTNSISLKQVTEKVLKQFNMSAIEVIDNENLKPFKNETISGEFGITCFDFIEKYAKKRQVLMTTNGKGNIVFTRGPFGTFNTHLILSTSAQATILSASINYNNMKRFNKYIGSSQNNPAGLQQFTENPIKIASVGSNEAIDDGIRTSRIYHFEPEFSTDQESLDERVKWEANFRRSQAQKLTYTVQGHIAKNDNVIWKPGYLVNVTDEFANILNGKLLISSVHYSFNLAEGSKTVLRLLPQDAFTLLVNTPIKEKNASKNDLSQFISIPVEQARKGVESVLKEGI